ncbi:hypothetical protein Ancab_027932 [Ancistrocladus abbreviatus]
MAMILRHQNEKSSIQMQANQMQRLAEEKQLHDQEVIESLHRIIMKHESERSLLEDQLTGIRLDDALISSVDLDSMLMQEVYGPATRAFGEPLSQLVILQCTVVGRGTELSSDCIFIHETRNGDKKPDLEFYNDSAVLGRTATKMRYSAFLLKTVFNVAVLRKMVKDSAMATGSVAEVMPRNLRLQNEERSSIQGQVKQLQQLVEEKQLHDRKVKYEGCLGDQFVD